VTGTTFVIASLAISGVPPFAGFWSKDEILSEAIHNGHPVLFAIALMTSLLTAFYMFRLIFLVLFGKARTSLHPHESPKVMTIPLSILAIFSIFIGLLGSPLTHNMFQTFIHGHAGATESAGPDYFVMGLSTLIALVGIGTAYLFYILGNKILPQSLRNRFTFLYNLLSNKYYVDELYGFLFIKPLIGLSNLASKFDLGIIDGAVNLSARIVVVISNAKAWVDRYIVDGAVNLVANIIGLSSTILRRIQTGYIQTYLLIAFLGLTLILFIKLM